jgi:hypothetical protein
MLIMMTVTAVVLGLIAVNFFALYRHALRDIVALSEYAQFLLLDPEVYAAQRDNFLVYLRCTGEKTSVARGDDAGKAVLASARNARDKVMLDNAARRNAARNEKRHVTA